jgi:hypothetical protein
MHPGNAQPVKWRYRMHNWHLILGSRSICNDGLKRDATPNGLPVIPNVPDVSIMVTWKRNAHLSQYATIVATWTANVIIKARSRWMNKRTKLLY